MKISELPEFDEEHLNFVLNSNDKVAVAIKLMSENHVGAVPVFENGKLAGIFSERDVTTRILAKSLDPASTNLAEVMTKNPQTITPETDLRDSIDRMIKGHYRHSLVVDENGKLLQVISQRVFVASNWFLSLLEGQEQGINLKTTLKEVIDSRGKNEVISLSSNHHIIDVVKLISERAIGAIPIIDNGKLTGIISERDVMAKAANKNMDIKNTLISEVMTKEPHTVGLGTLVSECLQAMALGQYRHILIIDDNGQLIKILSQRDFMSLHV